MWPVMFDPIQTARSERPQEFHVIGKERQADWKHPQARDWKKPKNAAQRQEKRRWNPEPPTGRLPDETNGRANGFRQPIDESLQTPVIDARGSRLGAPRPDIDLAERVHLSCSCPGINRII